MLRSPWASLRVGTNRFPEPGAPLYAIASAHLATLTCAPLPPPPFLEPPPLPAAFEPPSPPPDEASGVPLEDSDEDSDSDDDSGEGQFVGDRLVDDDEFLE